MDVSQSGKSKSNWKPVLCVGNAVVDCMNIVDKFPKEDSKQIGGDYYWQRGGNATNNCTVLSLLNIPCEFMGVLPTTGTEASWIRDDFHKAGIPINHCSTPPGLCPVSTSIINTESGSRTIIGFPRKCPELTHMEFKDKLKSNFSAYCWVHFELQSQTNEVVSMMREVVAYNRDQQEKGAPGVTLSVEVENPGSLNPESAMVEADFVFISKDFAMARGCQDIRQALDDLYVLCKPGSVFVCPWGDTGAGFKCNDDTHISPARAGVKVVDSLGAGDTFNAGLISSILKQTDGRGLKSPTISSSSKNVLITALNFACQVAGFKCCIFGYQGLKDFEFDQ